MSADLKITFGSDMPASAVEVLSPDSEVLDRRMLTAGASATVHVPSDSSSLRVHLPGGPAVTLTDPGNLDRTVTLESVLPSIGPNDTRRLFAQLQPSTSQQTGVRILPFSESSSRWRSDPNSMAWLGMDAPVKHVHAPPRLDAVLRDAKGNERPLSIDVDGTISRWVSERSGARALPSVLDITHPAGTKFSVLIPGNFSDVGAQAGATPSGERVTISVHSNSPAASAALNYLVRSDLEAADALTVWAQRAQELLLSNAADPYSAIIGGYLLLRLKKNAGIDRWTRNLADSFELPDASIIHAWQLATATTPPPLDLVSKYLLKAASQGTPTYTEGLRLLLEGLELLGPTAADARDQVTANLGQIMWTSPFTAWATCSPDKPAESSTATTYEVVAA